MEILDFYKFYELKYVVFSATGSTLSSSVYPRRMALAHNIEYIAWNSIGQQLTKRYSKPSTGVIHLIGYDIWQMQSNLY